MISFLSAVPPQLYFASRYALYSDNQTGVLDTIFAIIEVDSSVLSYSGIFADGYYKFGIRAIS